MNHRNVLAFTLILLTLSVASYAESIKDFTLPDMNNQQQRLSSLTGENLILLDFWASWCVPCTRLMPELQKIDQEFDNVTVVTVSIDTPRAVNKAKNIIRTQSYTFISLFDTNQDVMKQYQVTTVPHTFLLDTEGNIVYEHTGYTRGDEKELITRIKEFSQINKEE
jgi:cytochrome c biogenesis protein CcmG, thiol:disulfide interchange protein DsbE